MDTSVATLVSVLQKPSGECKKVSLNLCMKVGIFHKWVPLQCLLIAETGPSGSPAGTNSFKVWGIQGHNYEFCCSNQCYKSVKVRVALLTLFVFLKLSQS